jgi:hypothetical protein
MPVALVAPFAPSRRRVAACGSRSVVILRSPPVEAGGPYCLTKKPIRYLGSPLGSHIGYFFNSNLVATATINPTYSLSLREHPAPVPAAIPGVVLNPFADCPGFLKSRSNQMRVMLALVAIWGVAGLAVIAMIYF